MLLLIDSPGQLCNRLWSYTPFIAYALHHNVRVRVLFFGQYSGLFADVERFPNITFSRLAEKYEVVPDGLYAVVAKLPAAVRDVVALYSHSPQVGTAEELTNRGNRGLTLVKSWTAPISYDYLQTEHQRIAELFTPAPPHMGKVRAAFAAARSSYEIIVGVHIRRGDFREYQDGRYYYEDREYLRQMKSVLALLPNQRVGFFLCSNEAIRSESFAELSTFSLTDAEGIEDLYALTECDYLIGPLSTYSMWASYYGKKPLSFIDPNKLYTSLDDFRVVVAQNIFAEVAGE